MSNCTHTWVGGDLRQSKCSKCGILKEEFFREQVEEVEAKTTDVENETTELEAKNSVNNEEAKNSVNDEGATNSVNDEEAKNSVNDEEAKTIDAENDTIADAVAKTIAAEAIKVDKVEESKAAVVAKPIYTQKVK